MATYSQRLDRAAARGDAYAVQACGNVVESLANLDAEFIEIRVTEHWRGVVNEFYIPDANVFVAGFCVPLALSPCDAG
jgi:hypothetical protein